MMETKDSRNLDRIEATVAAQTRNIGVLADSIEHLAGAVDNRPTKSQARKFSLLLNFITLVVVGVLLVAGLNNINESHQSIKQSKKVLDTIEDCLSTDGECYQEQTARVGYLVTNVICRIEYAVQEGYETAGLPPYELSPECR